MKLLNFLLMSLLLNFAYAVPEVSKPKVIAEDIKLTEDFQKLLYPTRINAKLNSIVTADLDGHIVKVAKALGTFVKANETVLYIENTDPAFTYSAVAVKAPVSGVVSQVFFQMMSKVNKGDKLFTVINPNSVNLELEVPAAEIPYLKLGSVGNFQLTSNSDIILPVKIVGLSPVVDAKSGTASAKLEFIKTDIKIDKEKKNIPLRSSLQFPVGTVGQVTFNISLGKAVLISENAIAYYEGKATVFSIDPNNKAHRTFVELGEQRDSQFIIKTGLNPGEKVVVRSNKPVKDNEEVEIEKPNTGAVDSKAKAKL